MKNQSGSPGFRIQGKIFVYIYFMFYALAIVYFMFFRIFIQVIYVRGQNLHLVSELFSLQGDAFAVEGFCSGLW